MKKIISILLGICLCGGVFAQTQLKIISFNIHAGYDAPIADIAAFIKEQDPDIEQGRIRRGRSITISIC